MFRKNNDIIAYKEFLDEVNKVDLSNHEDSALQKTSEELISKAKQGSNGSELQVKAFSLVKEAIWRLLGLRVYDEQLTAGIEMYYGKLIEMQTGEGKTLTAVFTAYLNSITGAKVNIFTFNDYLAKRDAYLMGPVFRFLGLTVGYINECMDKNQRRAAYSCDITYVTAKEAGFDYLRDFLCSNKRDLIERPLDCIIIDEADSILIDEAKIPLVIATCGVDYNKGLEEIRTIIKLLEGEIHYRLDKEKGNVYFMDEGLNVLESSCGCENMYSEGNEMLLSQLTYALQAEAMYVRDVDYIVRNDKIELVDENTGRIAENRHWPDGLQAAIEIKEGLKNLSKGVIMSQITMQSFIKLHRKICGMTGTAVDSEREFERFYELEVVIIPPHKPCIRKDYPNLIFTHREAKYNAIVNEVIKVNRTGQPILIGTSSIKESVHILSMLKKSGVNCQVLNAKNDEMEAEIIARAGALNTVTVSTNMAGRGTDIKLGGPDEIDFEKVVKLGGLYIIGTSIYESIRIDKQLRGRAGRQGDPGMSRFFISLGDGLIKKFGVENIIAPKYHPEAQGAPLSNPRIEKGVEHLRKIINGKNMDLRSWQWRYSHIVEKQKIIIYNKRMEILKNGLQSSLIGEEYSKFKGIIDEKTFEDLQIKATLYHINICWADYLAYILDIRDMCYMEVLGGKNPLDKFQIDAVNSFEDFQNRVEAAIAEEFKNLKPDTKAIQVFKEKMALQNSTWTYLLKENSFEESLGLKLFAKSNAASAPFGMIMMWPTIFTTFIFERYRKKKLKK